MRALLVLIKRQIVDNAFYFALALVACAVLIVAVTVLALTEQRTHLSLYALALMVVLPIFFCAGSYTLGLLQARHDRSSGVAAVLAVLPAARGQILLARLVVGVLVILTVLGPLAIVAAVLWKFFGPPAWLVHGWLGDTFIGMALTAFACYCLGLGAGRSARITTRGLRALPLIFILLLLIVIKGFGWPLLAVLLPYIGVSVLEARRVRPIGRTAVLITEFMVLVFLAVPLFCGRYLCDWALAAKIPASLEISPLGLFPAEFESDPNLVWRSEVSARINRHRNPNTVVGNLLWIEVSIFRPLGPFFWENCRLLEHLGIMHYFQSRCRGERGTNSLSLSLYEPPACLIHLDEVAGLLVYHRKDKPWNDEYTWKWDNESVLYAGPKGVSATPDEALGRFESPVVYFGSALARFAPSRACIVYDSKSECFFAIDLQNQTAQKGTRIKNPADQPVVIDPADELRLCDVHYRSPFPRGKLLDEGYTDRRHLSVVRESGQIELLDPNTLELHGPAGHLPRPRTPFGWASPVPKDLLDYDVDLVAVWSRGETLAGDWARGKYLGLVVATLSREGLWMSLRVFDKDGKLVETAHSKAGLFDAPWGPAATIGKYLFESLHPPVLTLASFFTAYSFEARSTHRALFLMPNSFVAMVRDYQGNIFYALLIVALLMLPALFLAGLLAWRVERDATRLGLSPSARRLWLLGTLAFGLVGYITYRLSRPKVTLVTCDNCGHPRRPDMDRCHRCGSDWHVPELTPPDWRVLDGDAKERTSGYQETR